MTTDRSSRGMAPASDRDPCGNLSRIVRDAYSLERHRLEARRVTENAGDRTGGDERIESLCRRASLHEQLVGHRLGFVDGAHTRERVDTRAALRERTLLIAGLRERIRRQRPQLALLGAQRSIACRIRRLGQRRRRLRPLLRIEPVPAHPRRRRAAQRQRRRDTGVGVARDRVGQRRQRRVLHQVVCERGAAQHLRGFEFLPCIRKRERGRPEHRFGQFDREVGAGHGRDARECERG